MYVAFEDNIISPPATSSFCAGLVVPIPTLPPLVMRRRSEPLNGLELPVWKIISLCDSPIIKPFPVPLFTPIYPISPPGPSDVISIAVPTPVDVSE